MGNGWISSGRATAAIAAALAVDPVRCACAKRVLLLTLARAAVDAVEVTVGDWLYRAVAAVAENGRSRSKLPNRRLGGANMSGGRAPQRM